MTDSSEHVWKIGDQVQMRKQHPCGSDQWIIYRVGTDIGLRCVGCGRRVMLPRSQFLRQLKQILSSESGHEERDSTA